MWIRIIGAAVATLALAAAGAWLGTRIERARTVDDVKAAAAAAKVALEAAQNAAKAASRLEAAADTLAAQQAARAAEIERAGDAAAEAIERAARRLRAAPGGGRIVLDGDSIRLLDHARTGTAPADLPKPSR